MYRASLAALAVSVALASEAFAVPPPEPIVRILSEAVKTGNPATLKQTVDLAKTAYPASVAEIDMLVASLQAEAEAARIAKARQQGFLEGWSGEGEIGASHTSGTSRNTTVAAGIKFQKDGVNWRHRISALENYQKSDGTTAADRSLVGYEVNFKFTERLYALGLLQWERDQFAGFTRRFSESVGAGYSLVKTPEVAWDISGGPAWRQTRFVTHRSDSDMSARVATQFIWNITGDTVFSEDGGAFLGGSDNTYFSTTALTTKIFGDLSARLSFNVSIESNPPPGIDDTNTISRFTLVYSF